jgi:hypothetical protein
MEDDDNTDTGAGEDKGKGDGSQDKGGEGNNEAVSAAEERARKAEERAKQAEDKARKQEEAERRKKRDEGLKDLDAAKQALADAERREQEAIKRAEEAETRYRSRIEARVATLPKDVQDRLGEFKDALSADKWEKLVDMEFERVGAADVEGEGIPPAGTMGGRRHHPSADGRKLHPKSVEILAELGVDTTAAKTVLDAVVENEGGQRKGRFVYPQQLLKKQLKARAAEPQQLTIENYNRIFKNR